MHAVYAWQIYRIMHDSNKKFSRGKHKYLVQRHKSLINYSILDSKNQRAYSYLTHSHTQRVFGNLKRKMFKL